MFVRPLRPGRIARSVLGSRPSDIGTSDQWRSVDELLRNDAGVTDLLARDDALLADGVRTARSAVFLGWRYARVPSLRYGAHWVGEGAPRAAVIFRMNRRRGLNELMVCELLIADEHDGRRALREVLGMTRADYAVAHCAWGSAHRRAFVYTGFVPVPGGPHLTVRPLADNLEFDPTSFSAWRLALGDLEIF